MKKFYIMTQIIRLQIFVAQIAIKTKLCFLKKLFFIIPVLSHLKYALYWMKILRMSNFYFSTNKNIRSLGFREVRITIYNCDDFCRTCNGPTSGDCTSCY